MKYRGMDVIEAEVTPHINHTARVVERIITKQDIDSELSMHTKKTRPRRLTKSIEIDDEVTDKSTSKMTVGDVISKMFWQALASAMIFTALFCVGLFGGNWGQKFTGAVRSVISYNMDTLGTPDSDIGKIKFASLFGKKYAPPAELNIPSAVKDKEYLVLTDRVVYLTNVEEMVFSVAEGVVQDVVRDEHDLVSLRIVGKDYDTVYKKLEFCGVKDGERVKSGDILGSFSQNGLEIMFVLPDGAVVTGLDGIIKWAE